MPAIVIPPRFIQHLQIVGLKRFVKLSGKQPFEEDWNSDAKLYLPGDAELQRHLNTGGNYGVCSGNGLLGLDCDSDVIEQLASANLPPTYTDKTGSGKIHRWYISDCKTNIKFKQGDADLGEAQASGKQMVGAGSIHPNGKPYETIDDRHLAFVSESQLREVFKDYIKQEEVIEPEKPVKTASLSDKNELDISAVMKAYGITKNQGEAPWHLNSKNKAHLVISPDKGIWHCFRCDSGGDAWTLFAVAEGLLACEDAKPGALRGDKFLLIIERAKERGLIVDNKKQLKENNFQSVVAVNSPVLGYRGKCLSFEAAYKVLSNWFSFAAGDKEFLEVVLAATLDREIPGDPVWLYLIAPPGAFKSEILRAISSSYSRAYSLDLLTPQTLVSGLAEKDKDTGEYVPIAGILQDLDGKCLIIKDFTSVLNTNEDKREEIYGQLRSAYDGYLEKGFGTLRNPIRVKSKFGLIVGVTPIIDRYTSTQNALGERFLKIRNQPQEEESAKKALENEGLEDKMRSETQEALISFFNGLDFSKQVEINKIVREFVLKLACYTARMRANVWATYDSNRRVVDAEIANIEVPTRISKQLIHLLKLLVVVRGRNEVKSEDLKTLQRVVKDTAELKKQSIMEYVYGLGKNALFQSFDIAKNVNNLFRTNSQNHLLIMESAKIIKENHDQDMFIGYSLDDKFAEYASAVFDSPPELDTPLPPSTGQFTGKENQQLDGTLDEVLEKLPTIPLPESLFKQSDMIIDSLKKQIEASESWLSSKTSIPIENTLKILKSLERDGLVFKKPGGGWRLA